MQCPIARIRNEKVWRRNKWKRMRHTDKWIRKMYRNFHQSYCCIHWDLYVFVWFFAQIAVKKFTVASKLFFRGKVNRMTRSSSQQKIYETFTKSIQSCEQAEFVHIPLFVNSQQCNPLSIVGSIVEIELNGHPMETSQENSCRKSCQGKGPYKVQVVEKK